MSEVTMAEKNQFRTNKLCLRCIRQCKQSDAMIMLDCPRFQPRPFKSEVLKFEQLDLFDKG
ncbi:MAG: hypothetical protein KAG12_00150 [Desulfuromusa sp.]|nr:hypothetical protein [Desulfuromusa sp.]